MNLKERNFEKSLNRALEEREGEDFPTILNYVLLNTDKSNMICVI